jgi:hypothetical protein
MGERAEEAIVDLEPHAFVCRGQFVEHEVVEQGLPSQEVAVAITVHASPLLMVREIADPIEEVGLSAWRAECRPMMLNYRSIR